MRALLAVLALAALTDPVDAKCARPSAGSEILTPAKATVAADGGVLVAAATQHGSQLSGSEDGKNPRWRFTAAEKQVEIEMVPLAPGLFRYRPVRALAGAAALVDGKTTKLDVTFSATKPALLPAPVVTAVRYHTERLVRGGFSERVQATFKTAAPADAVAVVVFAVTKNGNEPRSWMRIDEGTLQTLVAGTAGRCDPGVPGEIISKPGDSIALAWVDAHGRLSKLSATTTVLKK